MTASGRPWRPCLPTAFQVTPTKRPHRVWATSVIPSTTSSPSRRSQTYRPMSYRRSAGTTQPYQLRSVNSRPSGAADALGLEEGGVGGDALLPRLQVRRLGRPVVGPDLGDPPAAVGLPVDQRRGADG